MLLHRDGQSVLAIGQASHAWLAAQLARAWGNEQFGTFEPWEEVCLAAEQHDVGMAAWDLDPGYDQKTGLPHSFMKMPLHTHLDLWLEGPKRLISQSTYAALLTSMHGWRLYERRDLDRSPPEEAGAIREFLSQQKELQAKLVDVLARDSRSAPAVERATLERNSLLLWTWDYISLTVCLDWAPATARGAPTRDGRVDLQIETRMPGRFTVDPWPFQASAVRVRCEGRRLPERFENESAMRRGLAEAPVETLELVIEPRA